MNDSLDKLVVSGADDGQIMLSSSAEGAKVDQISAYQGKVISHRLNLPLCRIFQSMDFASIKQMKT